jgi:hypothetical protein
VHTYSYTSEEQVRPACRLAAGIIFTDFYVTAEKEGLPQGHFPAGSVLSCLVLYTPRERARAAALLSLSGLSVMHLFVRVLFFKLFFFSAFWGVFRQGEFENMGGEMQCVSKRITLGIFFRRALLIQLIKAGDFRL